MTKANIDKLVTLTPTDQEKLSRDELVNGVIACIAAKAVDDASRECAPDKYLRLITSTATTYGDFGSTTLAARARLVSSSGPHHIVWQISVWDEERKAGQGASSVAEVTSTYEMVDRPSDAMAHLSADQGESVQVEDSAKHEEAVPVGLQKVSGESDIAAERKRQIFLGACKVIAKQGFGNASIREIAQAAGMSVPLMYKHIKDKEDILYLITSECMRDLLEYFDKGNPSENSPRENIRYAIERYINYINENRRYINLVYSETRALNAENRQKIFEMERRFMEYWKDLLQDGINRNAFKPVNTELYANYVYFLCTVWSLRYWSIDHFDDQTVKDTLVEFVLEGLTQG